MLAPSLYGMWEECMEIVQANLIVECMGHSVIIHSNTTLCSGTWGNNISSKTLWYIHLMNVSRITLKIPDMYIL